MKPLIKYRNQSGIYKITNIISNKFYIGSAIDLYKRTYDHKKRLEYNTHRNIHLQRSWNKHTPDAFIIECVAICPKEYLLKLEQWFIENLKPMYNIDKIAGSSLGTKRSEETKNKIRQTLFGKKQSPETIEKRVAWRRGVKQKPETLQKRALKLIKPIAQFDVMGNFIKEYPSLKSVSDYGFSYKNVSRAAVHNKISSGYRWKYISK